eukprot:1798626-Rhodomonas_salina.2
MTPQTDPTVLQFVSDFVSSRVVLTAVCVRAGQEPTVISSSGKQDFVGRFDYTGRAPTLSTRSLALTPDILSHSLSHTCFTFFLSGLSHLLSTHTPFSSVHPLIT